MNFFERIDKMIDGDMTLGGLVQFHIQHAGKIKIIYTTASMEETFVSGFFNEDFFKLIPLTAVEIDFVEKMSDVISQKNKPKMQMQSSLVSRYVFYPRDSILKFEIIESIEEIKSINENLKGLREYIDKAEEKLQTEK